MTGIDRTSLPSTDPPSSDPPVAGLVLAAGGGTRYGTPKALVRDAGGAAWLLRTAQALDEAGCAPVLVVLGARFEEAESLLGGREGLLVVRAVDWVDGLSASLEAGLRAVAALEPQPTAVAVVPVDVPDLTATTVARLIGELPAAGGRDHGGRDRVTPHTLRQARFDGRPGHPVVIGRSHWAALRDALTGDTGARSYLGAHSVRGVECGDLGTGVDIDHRPPDAAGNLRTPDLG